MLKADLWTKQSTVKVLRNKDYGGEFRHSLPLSVKMAKAEYESVQLVLTAREDVKSYTLAVTDLVSGNGDKISKESVEIYNVKYIYVKERENLEHGYFPDALLPFEKAIEYKENKIKAGENQSVWITVKTFENTPAGIYNGTVNLIVDGELEIIPFSVTVWDYAVPKETHVKSDFVIGCNMTVFGENDYSPKMYRAYVERLMHYRLAPHRIVQDINPPYMEGEDFVRTLRELTAEGKPYLSTISLPVYRFGDGINEKLYFRYLDALADACMEDNINYMERAAVYCGFIDEPHLNECWDLTNATCRRFEELKQIAAENFVSRHQKSQLRDQVKECILSLGNFVTTYFDDRLTEVKYWCPSFSRLAKEEDRAAYKKSGNELWWYGCGGPTNDCPSYAIGQSTLLDTRLMHWMQFDYGIKGSLFWETVMYHMGVWCQEIHCNLKYQIDCYEQAGRSAGNEGDGFLFYPGKPYGIFGPVDTIRLHAIRDGIEDYESLLYLETLYNKAGKSAKEILRPVYDRLYEGVKIKTDGDKFEDAREYVASLILDAKKGVYKD